MILNVGAGSLEFGGQTSDDLSSEQTVVACFMESSGFIVFAVVFVCLCACVS